MLTIGLISFEIGTGLPFLSVVRGDARKQVLVQPESIKAVKARHHEVNVVFCFYCIGEQKMMPIEPTQGKRLRSYIWFNMREEKKRRPTG